MAQASHGSAPDIAGKNIANPVGLMLSAVMMFEWLAAKHNDPQLIEAANLMQNSIFSAMKDGVCTPDIKGKETTTSFTQAIVQRIEQIL
jgi:3-isopropylmalate dehydrogenase